MGKAGKVIAGGAAAGVAALVAACMARATRLEPTRPKGPAIDAGGYRADDAAVERFREVLRIPTVSRGDVTLRDDAAFEEMAITLRRLFPHAFAAFDEPLHFSTYGFLMRMAGDDPSLAPILLMAHHDVVPVDGQDWTYPPFEAQVHDGQIWARGALDNKLCLCGCLEAFEHLTARGWRPPRDVWFFSSCEEELFGPAAERAAAWLADNGIHPCLVLDEGGAIATDVPLGVECPVAMVGVSEKGYLDLTVTANAPGGHASSPSENDATRLLVRAVENICDNPGSPQVMPAVEAMLSELASRGSLAYRMVFANMWLFRPLVRMILAAGEETGAMVQTTYALTQLQGSTARNVLPPVATANINVRVAPFETAAQALERAQALADEVADEAGMPGAITVEVADDIARDPAPVSPYDDAAFDYIRRCVAGVYPEAGCTPYIQTSGSDAHAMSACSDHVYRMAGFVYSKESRELIHGTDERIPVDVYKRGLEFYVAFLRGLSGLEA